MEKEFAMILYFGGTVYNFSRGKVGTANKMKDKNGVLLNVGDIVKINFLKSEQAKWTEHFVVENDNKKQFINGISLSCKKNGEIVGWDVELVKKYYDLKGTEVLDNIYIKKNS